MKLRPLLIGTAILSSLLGGVIVYLLMSVPNDLRADALLSEAKRDISAGRHDEAWASLTKIVQQYPRTDAAAAATIALVSLAKRDRDELAVSVGLLRKVNDKQAVALTDLQRRLAQVEKATAPKPPVVGPPAPPKAPVVKKKPAPRRRTTTRRRR